MPAPLIEVVLRHGSPTLQPASAATMAALTRIEVRRGEDAPSGFQLEFEARVEDGEIDLIAEKFGDPWARIVISVEASALESDSMTAFAGTLIDGFVTGQDYVAPSPGRPGRLIVTGEDASVKMDLVERSVEYPAMSDGDIVRRILGRYATLVDMAVTAPEVDAAPSTFVPQQNGTDLAYLRHLARRHGAVFHVAAGTSGKPVAYWGPPRGAAPSTHALTVGAGAFGNVETLRFRRSMLTPSVSYGAVLDVTASPPTRRPVAISSASRSLGYAATAALEGGGYASDPESYTADLAGLGTRGRIVREPWLDQTGATASAQGYVDRAQDRSVVATGSVDTSVYGALLLAPGTVEVRGAGTTYDGKYHLTETVHIVELGERLRYTQQFTMVRDGTGATENRVTP